MEPLFRWVGSKRWARKTIVPIVQQELYPNGTYWEPFAGGASIFFAFNGNIRAVLADTLEPLINTYREIRESPIGVWKWSNHYAGENGLNKETYARARDRLNDRLKADPRKVNWTEVAGLFVYLNRACFNGLWRQNTNGEFNVPIGDMKRLRLPSQAEFLKAQSCLASAELEVVNDHRSIINMIMTKPKVGDVIFADPPYLETFNDYDGLESASADFQEELANALWRANLKGATIIATNADNDRIRKWYGAFCEIHEIERHQGIAGTVDGRKQWQQILAVAT